MTQNNNAGQSSIAMAKAGERRAAAGQADPFPPEGTDETLLEPGAAKPHALSQNDRIKATQAAIASEGQATLVKP